MTPGGNAPEGTPLRSPVGRLWRIARRRFERTAANLNALALLVRLGVKFWWRRRHSRSCLLERRKGNVDRPVARGGQSRTNANRPRRK